jgi:predicted dithiol-disulfide oxidoreductase (DUF899 family)
MAAQVGTGQTPRVVSHQQWVTERAAFLAKEKELTRLKDQLSRERRDLPWEKLTKSYVFEGPRGPETLADLFEGRTQLLVYHFMFGPERKEGCFACSFVADHFDATLPHLGARDTTLVVISRAPYPKLEAFRHRMGWRFKWVSSGGNDFNYDFGVSFTDQQKAAGVVWYNYGSTEYPGPDREGASVFARHDGDVFHSYSTYGRGVEALMGTYSYLDLMPKGRDEDRLDFSMAWVRYHDRYGK